MKSQPANATATFAGASLTSGATRVALTLHDVG
ncbi:hypothetical protein J2S45_000243 [Trueperella abortisuis]|uniref:Uncharacterized protein n=1 Tax=Trueperella abortisuis TaxID=445930 RepID=A0ABT9PFS5_9ACTO|nr:hypothetical protein [Trueperella abortisuis]